MDRGIIYPGQVPLETDLLFAQQAGMLGLSKLAAAMFGTATIANGFAVTQTAVASMSVQVAPGEIYQNVNLEGTAYSSLPADTTHTILKQGVSLDAVLLALTAPGTVGFSINYLIQATFAETDSVPVVLPYYNASNPATAYSGPANAGTAQNTRRLGKVTLTAKAGIAAATGSQATPAPDAGNVGLYVVTVANGAVSVVNANISAYSGAPVLPAGGLVVGGLQGNGANVSAAGGTADALTGVFTPAITALTNGMTLYLRAGSANATTTPTFSAGSGIAAKTIVKGNGLALAAGDIAGAGHWIELQYDATLDKWVLLNPASGVTTRGVQRFTANGNFTVPAGVTTIYVSGAAGGAGGGGAAGNNGVASQAGGGGGGAAGQWALRQAFAVVPGAVIAITIGAAGSAGSGGAGGVTSGGNGGNGGNTVVGALVTLTGGSAGSGGTNSGGATIGAGGGGGNSGGGAGGSGDDGAGGAGGGAGGGSPFGVGAPRVRGSQGTGVSNIAPTAFGSGGGGGSACYAASVAAGGSASGGQSGLVIIEW